MIFASPAWDELTAEERYKLMEAAEVYSRPDDAGPEEIASEMFYVVQEVLRARGIAGRNAIESMVAKAERAELGEEAALWAQAAVNAATALQTEVSDQPEPLRGKKY